MNSPRQLRVSAWAIDNPITIAVLFIALLIVGGACYFSLPIKNLPNVDYPVVAVHVTEADAAPEDLKIQVTRPIEDAIAGIAGVQSIRSNVRQSDSLTYVQFDLGTDMIRATDDVRAKVEALRARLPREIDPPAVYRVEFDDPPIITYALEPAPGSTMSDDRLSWIADNDVARALQRVTGVGRVTRIGGVDREINVIIDPVRMAAHGVTAPQVNQALATVADDSAGGRVQVGGREQTLRVLGSAATVDQIRNLALPLPGGKLVRLTDVADVGDGRGEARSEAFFDGKPVVGFQISKTEQASDVDVEDGVDRALRELVHGAPGVETAGRPPLTPDVRVRKIVTQVEDTRSSFAATFEALIEGIGLASLVVWLFLRDWRATAITAVAMPMSVVPTFAFMALLDFSLDEVTLLALTLVIGILVDDAIVEVENIEKRMRGGMRPYEAAKEGADQIGLAVVATTVAIVAVFAPVSWMPGVPGQFFREFGLTISAAVLFSLAVARLLTPLLAAHFLAPVKARGRVTPPAFYARSLSAALDHRGIVVGLGVAVFAISILLAIVVVPKGLQPASNANALQVNVETPPGSTLEDTRRAAAQVAAVLANQPEVVHVFTSLGAEGDGGPSPPSTTATVTAVLNPERAATLSKLRDRLRPSLADVPDARVTFEGDGFGGSTVNVVLSSATGIGLDEAALELQREMASLRTLSDPRPSTSPPAPELIVRPRPDDAARLGVSAEDVAQVVRVATVGDIDANVAKFDVGGRRIPIRVRLPIEDRSNLSVIRDLRLTTVNGGQTTLGSVADIYFQAGAAQIRRYNQRDDIAVLADLTGDAKLSDANREVARLPIMHRLPSGVVHELNYGNQQAQNELFSGFETAITVGVALVYAVMVLLFGSFFKPVTILSALPLSITGAMIALLVCDSELSIPSMIGLFMLMGITAKNSILLVEYAINRERAGVGQRAALIEACEERARPIVMTTFAMMAGMLPTALGIGEGAEFRQPMAVAVIGGLISSTALSLIVVPAVYAVVDDVERWLGPWFAQLVAAPHASGVRVGASDVTLTPSSQGPVGQTSSSALRP